MCQFSDSYLEARSRNSRKSQPAKFAVPPCTIRDAIKKIMNDLGIYLL